MQDPYEILQVSRNAEIEVIEAAYRRLARKYHPDVNPSADANRIMKEINWAYAILSDATKRRSYDRSRSYVRQSYSTSSTRGYARREPPKPSPPPQSQSERTKPPPVATKPQQERTFLQKNWLLIVIALGVYFIYLSSTGNNSSPDVGSITSNQSRSVSDSKVDPYADCIDWTETDLYDGENKCVIGKIIQVRHEFDTQTGSDVWTGYFGFNQENDFRLISVDRDISKWQGQCVVVYGTLFDRELLQDYVDKAAPSMVDSDPFDERGFSISEAPPNKCK